MPIKVLLICVFSNKYINYHVVTNLNLSKGCVFFVEPLKRSFHKINGERTMNILQQFLLSYRSTPTPALPNNKTPAKFFLLKPILTTFSFLHPAQHKNNESDTKIEKQFNHQHKFKASTFVLNQLVFCRDYQNLNQRWIPSTICKQLGKIVYLVELNGKLVN